MNIDDNAPDVDFTSDIGDDTGVAATTTNTPVDTSAPKGDEATDVRSLLNKAIKGDLTPEGPTRGPDGKFIKQQPVTEGAQAQEGQQQQVQSDAPINQRFKSAQEYHDHVISAIPEGLRGEVQQFLEYRDTAFNNWAQNATNTIRGYEAMEQIIAPRRELWAMHGLQPEQAINQLLALSDFAGRDPAGFIRHIADQHGIDLAEIGAGSENEYVDPEVAALRRELNELKGFRDESVQQQQTQAQQAEHSRLVAEVERFKATTDANGGALHPHFDAVEQDIIMILPGLKQANPNAAPQQLLKDAYERAIWANPEVRGKVAEAERLRRAQENAVKARRAGSSVAGAPGSAVAATTAEPTSVRDALKLAIAQHS